MKKALLTLSLLGLAGAAAFGVASFQNNPPLEVKADSEPITYIAMTASAFTSETDANRLGDFSPTTRTYWAGWSFEALDTFFCGESKEAETGTLELKPWTQTTRYIYFQWGAAADNQSLEFVCTNTTAEEGEDNYQYVYSATHRNDTQVDNKLFLRYFEIPAEEYEKLGGSSGFSMTIKLNDETGTGEYKFHSFGWLHPNQTKDQVSDAMRYYLNHLSQSTAEYEVNARKSIQSHYFTNAYHKALFYDNVASDVAETFDSQSNFINHWYFDHKYYNGVDTSRNFDGAISTATAHPGSMPYNMEGDGFFRGYLEGDSKGGFMSCDNSVYRFISRPVVIDSENPYVSIKMGGLASFHVIDATVNPGDKDDADLAWIDANTKNTSGIDGLVYSGFNVTTMKRFVINLQAYAGRTVQFAIADIGGGGSWEAANFDELKVNFTPTAFDVDTIVQTTGGSTYYCTYADKYVNSNFSGEDANGIIYKNSADKVADTTDVKAAADFLSNYYGVIRNTDNGTSFCGENKEILTSDPVKGIVASYNALTEGAQKIVCASTDYQQGTYATKDTWFEQAVVSSEVGTTLEYIASYNNINTTTYANLVFFGNNTTAISATVFVGIVGIGAVVAFLLLKKRKEKAE